MNAFSVSSAIRFAWDTFRHRAWFFVGMTVAVVIVVSIIRAIVTSLAGGSDTDPASMNAGAIFVNLALSTLLNMGVIAYALKAHDTPDAVELQDLWHPQVFWQYMLATVLVLACVGVGFIFLVVPGIFVGLMFMFTPYLVVDRNLGALEAMRESRRITEGSKWSLLRLAAVIFLINLAGALAFLVGLLVSLPISMLAIAHAYRQLEHRGNELITTASAKIA